MLNLNLSPLKKVLLTGSTSFVGGATVARLLSSTDTEVVALVRARSETEGEGRVHASIARFGVSAPVLLRRLRVLHSGLGAPLDRTEVSDVTHVLDALGPTLSAPRNDVRRGNVHTTHICIARLRALPRLERFLHVRRAWICGVSPPHSAHERDCPKAMAVGDRVATSLVRLLAQPRLTLARHRLSVGEDGGAFHTSIHACVVTRHYPRALRSSSNP